MDNTILENGVELEATPQQIELMLQMDMLYKCEECGFYHCTAVASIETVESFIKTVIQ